MNATSLSLILDKLETIMSFGQSMAHAAKATGMADNTLDELTTTLDTIERELQQIRNMLETAEPAASKKSITHTESPYYSEDDYIND